MTTSKTTTAQKRAAKPAARTVTDTAPKHVGTDTINESPENAAQAALGRVKEAIPSLDDVTSGIRERTNVDLPNMADDAAMFVRRNPATSIAAAAGIGILIGILATRRY